MAIPPTYPENKHEQYARSRDEAGFYSSAPFYNCRLVLASADTSYSLAVPAGAVRCEIDGDDTYYVRPNEAVPALSGGDVTNGTAGLINKPRMNLEAAGENAAVSTLYFRAPYANTSVTIAFYGK